MLIKFALFILVSLSIYLYPSIVASETAQALGTQTEEQTGTVQISTPEIISFIGVIKNHKKQPVHIIVLDSENKFVSETYSNMNGLFNIDVPAGQYLFMLKGNYKERWSGDIDVSKVNNRKDFEMSGDKFSLSELTPSINTLVGAVIGFFVSIAVWRLQKNHETNELSKNIPMIIDPTFNSGRDFVESMLTSNISEESVKLKYQKTIVSFETLKKDYSWLWSKINSSDVTAVFNIQSHLYNFEIFFKKTNAMQLIKDMRDHVNKPYNIDQIKNIEIDDKEIKALTKVLLEFNYYLDWLKGKYI